MENIKLVENIIEDNSLEYSGYVIKNRALPDIRDGMKPVYRRILYTMYLMKAYTLVKSQNINGQVMRFHAHGDCYGTMVGMAQKDNNLTPLITGKGNFAQHTSRDLQAAAPRYTECKLSDISRDMMKDLDKDIVDFIPNFDGSEMMPEVLPVKFPAILHYAQEGIAVGMSSRLPSFNLVELNNAIIKYIQTNKKTLLIPDFATGAYIINNNEVFTRINNYGLGSIRMRAKASIENNVITVTEIPYSTTREAIIDKIIDLIKSGKLKEVNSVTDLTGLNGLSIEIVCKKSTDMNLMLEKLYQYTPMESTYSCNMNIIIDGLPKVVGVWSIIDEWLFWRSECVRRGLRYEINKLSDKLNILKGLEKVLLDIDEVIKIIRFSNDSEVIDKLMKFFNINEIQADYVVNMRLRDINKDHILKQIKDIQGLEDLIKYKNMVLESDDEINKIICNDLETINSKYGIPRRSKIINLDIEAKLAITKIKNDVPDYDVKIILTKDGYIKKVNPTSKVEHKLKEGDYIVEEYETNNKNEIIIFSGTDAYKIRIETLPDISPNVLGDYIPNLLDINSIEGYSIIDDKYKFILVGYDNGKISKVDLESFKTESNRKKLSNSLYKNAKVYKIATLKDDCDFIIINNKSKEIIKNTSQLPLKSARASQGSTLVKDTIDFKLI